MSRLRILLIALIFALHSLQGATASVKTCCEDMECNVVQCAVMKCLAEQAPIITPELVQVSELDIVEVLALPLVINIPLIVTEVWHPPD